MKTYFFLLLALLAPAACAQDQSESAEANAATFDPAGEVLTETEQSVQAIINDEGIYVVHFWAPWCHNSNNEFKSGFWPELIEAQKEIEFIFVTVYNDGHLGESTLERYDIPERVHRFSQPDHGASNIRSNRRRTFLGLPLTWTPTTWIFHRRGKLAFAVNHGEVNRELLTLLLDKSRTDWSH